MHVEFTSRILHEKTIEPHALQIRNGRNAAEPPSLEREGFEVATWPSRVASERLDELAAPRPLLEMRQVEIDYWDETIPLIRKLSGAREVLPLHAAAVRFSNKAKKPENVRRELHNWCHPEARRAAS